MRTLTVIIDNSLTKILTQSGESSSAHNRSSQELNDQPHNCWTIAAPHILSKSTGRRFCVLMTLKLTVWPFRGLACFLVASLTNPLLHSHSIFEDGLLMCHIPSISWNPDGFKCTPRDIQWLGNILVFIPKLMLFSNLFKPGWSLDSPVIAFPALRWSSFN